MSDEISKPSHYTQGNIEVIDFIEDQNLGYHLGNVVKYICRHKHKGTPRKDIQKAQWYLERYFNEILNEAEILTCNNSS